MLDSSKRFGWDKEEAAQKFHENTYRVTLNQKADTLKQNLYVYELNTTQRKFRKQINLPLLWVAMITWSMKILDLKN